MTVESTNLSPAGQAAGEETATAKPAQYTDGYAYEVPRPFLTLNQAASILGKSLRTLERSLLGRWGNKLPDGWVARKIRTERGEEWRILPPPGFRVRHLQQNPENNDAAAFVEPERIEGVPMPARTIDQEMQINKRKQTWRPQHHTMDQPTIVIDRSEEVEHLLRELVTVQHSLSEERRLHLEDMRLITQMQGSMRLLEVNAAEQARAKAELEAARNELSELKEQYSRLINLPWWKRLFGGKG